MTKDFKPMLGVMAGDITFPIYVSTKLDGIRCVTIDGELKSRSLKPIRNKALQERHKEMCEEFKKIGLILDGELFSPVLTFQEITSIVMSEDKEAPEHLQFCVFDAYDIDSPNDSFKDRIDLYKGYSIEYHLAYLDQNLINSKEELDNMFKKALEEGNEGLIIRSPDMPYKFGRSTAKEQGLLKMKPFETFDGKIKDVLERMENTSESEKNELGHSFKHRCKDDMIPTGIAAAFVVEYEGMDLKVVLTGDEDFRRKMWEEKESYIGKWIEYKAMLIGIKNLPRHPNFLRFISEESK